MKKGIIFGSTEFADNNFPSLLTKDKINFFSLFYKLFTEKC